ncbi:MAG TPA: RNA-binding protein [Roseiflexaceae bacterium]|nr:RNA-binding protein [Roseiflexaceae bacterium]
MNLYVGNLASQVTEEELERTFGAYGKVQSATIIRDKFSGDSRGFGFVEMPSQEEGLAAIAGLAGVELQGRRLTVNEARPRDDRRSNDRNRRGGSRW